MKDEECDCKFDPAPEGEDPELHYHFRRTCPACKEETLSLHCIHDGIQGPCVHCGRQLPSVRRTA